MMNNYHNIKADKPTKMILQMMNYIGYITTIKNDHITSIKWSKYMHHY